MAERSYLGTIAWAFCVVTVANSAMMLTGLDTAKTGTFAYVHLLSRLGIIALVVGVIDVDDVRDDLRRLRHRRAHRAGRPAHRDGMGDLFGRLLERAAQAPGDAVVAAFTVVTVLWCLVAIAMSPWSTPRGDVELYRGLLILFAVSSLVVWVWAWWHPRRRDATPSRGHELR
jgi:hypothetical protein